MRLRLSRLGLLSLAAALLLGYYLWDATLTQKSAEKKTASKKILTLEEGEEVREIRFQRRADRTVPGDRAANRGLTNRRRADSEVRLEKNDGRWKITEPIQYPGEDFIVEGVVSLLRMGAREESFPLKEMPFEDMELDHPKLIVTVGLGSPSERRSLEIGGKNPVSGLTYVRWQDEEEVFMVSEQFVRSLDKDLFSLRSKKVFDWDLARIDSIEGKWDRDEFHLVREGESWKIIKPEEKIADLEEVRGYLDEVNSLYVREFFDDLDWKNPDLGLQEEKNFLRVKSGEKEWQLLIGAENKEKQGYYALKKGEGVVLLISSPRIVPLQKPYTGFLPRYLFSVLWDQLDEIRLRELDSEVKLVREAGLWQLQNKVPKDVEDFRSKVDGLIEFLSGLKYETILKENKMSGKIPALSLRLSGQGKDWAEVDFFEQDDGVVAQIKKRPETYELDRIVLVELRDYWKTFKELV